MRKRLYGDDLLTRAELGKAIKKSKTTIRRWEAQGKLKPLINERGVRLYRVADVKTIDASAVVEPLPQARAHVQTAGQVGGELASEVFARCERGEGAVKIVTDLRVHPDVVDGLMKRWARFKRTILLSRENVYAIEDSLKLRVREFTAEDLVEKIRRLGARMATCRSCKKNEPYMCSECANARATRCDWCKQRASIICHPCLDTCVGKALARHGVVKNDDDAEDDYDDDENGEDDDGAVNEDSA